MRSHIQLSRSRDKMFNKNLLVVVVLLVGAAKINGYVDAPSDIKGRLLTPEEGCGLSRDPATSRIMGGQEARKGAWPWLALLASSFETVIKTRYIFLCGGTLITSRHVLSAAHCFKRDSIDTVRLGEHDTRVENDARRITIGIARVDKHANYSSYLVFHTNDIALVHLKHDVEFTDYIRPICLPTSKEIQSQSFINTSPFVAGWGRLKQNAEKMSEVLHQVQVPIIDNTKCKENYQNIFVLETIPDFRLSETSVLCAGDEAGGRDSCRGDSGGPLMAVIPGKTGYPFYQIGIVSSGLGCGNPNIPGLYTNVLHQMDWIQEKLKM